MEPPLKAITLDLWNTIFVERNYKEERVKKFSSILEEETLFIEEKGLLGVYDLATEEYEKQWKNEYKHFQNKNRLDLMIHLLKIDISNKKKEEILEVFSEVFLSNPPEFKPNVKETVSKLASKIKLGIISDTGVTPGAAIRKHFEDQGMLKYFQSTIFSDELGYCKPHHIPFQRALSELDVNSKEAMHVGDLLRTDILGAKNCGMKTVWIKEKEQPKIGVNPDYVIKDFKELLIISEIKSALLK
jgi:putative hydrolase of the HAD superfamily